MLEVTSLNSDIFLTIGKRITKYCSKSFSRNYR